MALLFPWRRIAANCIDARPGSSALGLGASQALGNDKPIRNAFLREYGPFAEAVQQNYTNITARWVRTTDFANGKVEINCSEERYDQLNFRSVFFYLKVVDR